MNEDKNNCKVCLSMANYQGLAFKGKSKAGSWIVCPECGYFGITDEAKDQIEEIKKKNPFLSKQLRKYSDDKKFKVIFSNGDLKDID